MLLSYFIEQARANRQAPTPPTLELPPAIRQAAKEVPPRVRQPLAEMAMALEDAKRPPPAIDPRHRRDIIAEQPNPPAYVAWLLAKD
jgi:hypothetical protein